jgi:cytochrome c-type biogenesis protein CcmH/NrfG
MEEHEFDLAVSHIVRGEHDRALLAFQEIVRKDPEDGRAWSYLGLAHAHLGHGEEAEQALAKAVELSPGNAEAWFHLGVARSIRSEWSQAAAAYRHAVACDPNDLMGWHRLGTALAESGDEGGATAAFERALVLSHETGGAPTPTHRRPTRPDDHLPQRGTAASGLEAQSWLDLALRLLSLGEEEEAIAAYDRAAALDPTRASRSLFKPMLRLLSAASESA